MHFQMRAIIAQLGQCRHIGTSDRKLIESRSDLVNTHLLVWHHSTRRDHLLIHNLADLHRKTITYLCTSSVVLAELDIANLVLCDVDGDDVDADLACLHSLSTTC
mmetsp:Transcript_84032/g.132702  ORF Transcript_84032/g.132702 Transcript_84032/m.132702 type:complete len:105 (-) Transcript_84032:316-630(-)